MNKMWYTSKTLWVNVLAIIGIIFFQGELSPELMAGGLAIINMILRAVTKSPVVWKNGKK